MSLLIRAPRPSAPASPLNSSAEAWHNQSSESVLAHVGSLSKGLTAVEAASRLLKEGRNELQAPKHFSSLRILLDQFKSLIIWILLAAGAISAFAGEATDAMAILAIVVINAAIGFYQEYSAEKSLLALKHLTAPLANVRRDGVVVSVKAVEIVPGDILSFEAGDLIAADVRLLEGSSLKCVEAALTGESEAVAKQPGILDAVSIPLGDRSNMLFSGTSVAAGTGIGVVVATGMRTELGRIAALIVDAGEGEKTPLQQKLNAFGRVLVWATLGIIGLLFLIGILRGHDPKQLLLTAISLAVAAVPEGLPAVVTVALALGVRRMALRRALVRKLSAVETLGSVTVICTDKTGTLTVGEMTVRELYVGGQSYEVTGEGYGPDGEVQKGGQKVDTAQAGDLLELATLFIACNHARRVQDSGAWKLIGDPTEGALLVAGIKVGANAEQIESEWPVKAELPFDSTRKLGTMVRKVAGDQLRSFTHGAPGVVLKRCTHIHSASGILPLTDSDRTRILGQTTLMAKRALRVLASAYRNLGNLSASELTSEAVENELVFVGLSGMHDPARPEAKEAVLQCLGAGIRVVMITGDHPETASAIARGIGIASGKGQAITGIELDGLSHEALRERVPTVSVYSRVTAGHKLRIVRALKANQEVVAMTGDGVNDAPAIKGADIGIAMGMAGSEVTKQASDMIITNSNFATIVAAIEEGRGIYDNIRQTLQYLLAGSAGELMLMTACLVLGMPIPLLPIHLLWINLVTDGLPAICLATNPIDADVMNRPPRSPSERITTPRFLRTLFLTGCLTAAVAFAVYYHTLKVGTVQAARTSAFSVLVFAELFRAFGARSDTKPLWRLSPLVSTNLVLVVLVSVGLQVLSQHNTFLGHVLKSSYLPYVDCLWFFGLGSVPLIVLELVKLIRQRGSKDNPIAVAR